jgi:hypothetical protein
MLLKLNRKCMSIQMTWRTGSRYTISLVVRMFCRLIDVKVSITVYETQSSLTQWTNR